jgi:hypothetical protein
LSSSQTLTPLLPVNSSSTSKEVQHQVNSPIFPSISSETLINLYKYGVEIMETCYAMYSKVVFSIFFFFLNLTWYIFIWVAVFHLRPLTWVLRFSSMVQEVGNI